MRDGSIHDQEWAEIQARRDAEAKERQKTARKKKMATTCATVIAAAIALLLGLAVIWVVSALMVYIICWAFDLTYSLRLVTGVWAILALLRMTIVPTNDKK